MIAFRRILCPIDFSGFSDRAFAHACRLARWYEADVHALHVIPLLAEAWAVSFPVDPHTHEPHVPADLKSQLDSRLAAARADGTAIETHVREGGAAHEILRYSRENGIDIIVMGTHGGTGFRRLVLGSVADVVLRQAPCPVLTVCHAPLPDKGAGPPFQRILCASDFAPSAAATSTLAMSLAAEYGAELTLLHVAEPFFEQVFADHTHVPIQDYEQFVKTQLESRLRQAIPADFLEWCRPRVRVRIGAPAEEIVKGARELDADLLVMGLHGGRGAVDRALFGSTTQNVLQHAECPVLTPGALAAEPADHPLAAELPTA
jgi:nucleotide-binding universal stress UspA family protein